MMVSILYILPHLPKMVGSDTGTALRHRRREQLGRDGERLEWHAQSHREIAPEAEILLAEHGPETRRVIAGHGLIGNRAPHVAVAGRAGLEHLKRSMQVEAGLGGQHHRLRAGSQHRQREQIVDDLEGDPVPWRSDVKDVSAGRVEQWFHSLKILRRGTHHEEQRARVRFH